MQVLIGCDVDPELPADCRARDAGDVWSPLDRIPRLLDALGDDLPRMTWLIRSDESVRHATGDPASGYLSRPGLWAGLVGRGHELGWHMHVLSVDPASGGLVVDPQPAWLESAHAALARHFPVRATRTGWDYGSAELLGRLDALGVAIDFSALPGNKVWYSSPSGRVVVDWLRAPAVPYRPSRSDHQRPGPDPLGLLEVPVAQFRNSARGRALRWAWRLRHGCLTLRGLGNKTRLLTERWPELPRPAGDVWAFHFHPVDLSPEGIAHLARNVERLRGEAGARFVTASEYLRGTARPS